MRKFLLSALAACCFSAPTAAQAEYVAYFNCRIADGYTLKDLEELRLEFMKAAKATGLGPGYQTHIMAPIFNDVMAPKPRHFRWRGRFTDGAEWGRLSDWFIGSEFVEKFDKIMHCDEGSLWFTVSGKPD